MRHEIHEIIKNIHWQNVTLFIKRRFVTVKLYKKNLIVTQYMTYFNF
jgi:hypothetical protein